MSTALARYIGDFIADADATQRTYDCTQPEIYEQFLKDVAQAITIDKGLVVTMADVKREIDRTPTLNSHPMLQRERYFSNETASFDQPSTSLLTTLSRGWRSFTNAIAPQQEPLLAARAEDESTRVREYVANALATAEKVDNPNDGQWYTIVNVQYDVRAASVVEKELVLAYPEARADPYIERIFVFNRTHAYPNPSILCVTLYFRRRQQRGVGARRS